MTKPKTTTAADVLQFWKDFKDFMDACSYSLIAASLGLRKGEKARKRALKPDSEWAPEIEWWFEIGVSLHPIYQEASGPAKAMIVAWIIRAIKDWVGTLRD